MTSFQKMSSLETEKAGALTPAFILYNGEADKEAQTCFAGESINFEILVQTFEVSILQTAGNLEGYFL